MDAVRWDRQPLARRPILVAAFSGWNDAGDAATGAVAHLARTWGAERFASLDAESFFDFTSNRPNVRLEADGTRLIEWPTNDFFLARLPGTPHDVVLLVGTEPQLRWRTFCEQVLTVVDRLRIEMVVTLGALLADVPHTQPVRVTGSAADPELADRLQLHSSSRYEGPTGIVGVLGDALRRSGVPAATLWASVPHYVGQTPSPKATLALVQRASSLIGVRADASDLEVATRRYETKVTELVEADPDIAAYVAQLEHDGPDPDTLDEADDTVELTLESGDALAEEVERFLREHGSR
jgi:proteasome assembly chaperone (PAC2) family protein